MSETTPATGFKPKKSVALSGVPAGNTALCTVGRSGNDLSYRGYDILDIADKCEFEEVAFLLIHGKLPNQAELDAYKAKLRRLRGLPVPVRAALEALPASSHPMDVMRTGTSVLGCTLPEKDDHNVSGARDIADRLIASLGSMLVYWYHYSHSGVRIAVETRMTRSATSCTRCTGASRGVLGQGDARLADPTPSTSSMRHSPGG
jgi:2-methylcitrate synthase